MIDSDRDIMNSILQKVISHNIQQPCYGEIKDSLTRYLNRYDIEWLQAEKRNNEYLARIR